MSYNPKRLDNELVKGVRSGQYRRVMCRQCGEFVGWMHKRIFGMSVYCQRCVERARK